MNIGTKKKGKLICNSPKDIISGNFDSEKVGQEGFYYRENISLNDTNITHTKNHICG